MELVIKPTRACNFKCTFCSSNKICNRLLPLTTIYNFLQENPNTQTIIVNGGDPLMMKPSYYLDILKYIEDNNLDTTLSFTSNMWNWYLHPEKWREVFHHPRFSIGTSFQYGKGRVKPDGTDFSEDDFLKIQELFFKEFGYHLSFISVITNENEHMAIKNVELAKQLDTKCKLNGAVKSGRQGYLYSRVKLFKLYLQLFENGLWQWEDNCLNLLKYFNQEHTICPLTNKTCINNIRCMGPDGRLATCPSLHDDGIYDSSSFNVIKNDCYMCECFPICNGCYKRIHDIQLDGIDCEEFKKVYLQLKEKCFNVKRQ